MNRLDYSGRLLLSFFLSSLLVGCVHRDPSTWVTQQQISQFTEKALKTLHTDPGNHLPNGGTRSNYDSTQLIRYMIHSKPSPTVVVRVPTRTIQSSFTFAEFHFDLQSGEITSIRYGMIQ